MNFFTKFLDHLSDILAAEPLKSYIGYVYMFGLILFLLHIVIRHRKEFWNGIKGKDGRLELPEMISFLVMIIYMSVVIADVFIGLKPSESVFWSLNTILLYTLTGRIFMNTGGKNPLTQNNGDASKGSLDNVIQKIEEKFEEPKPAEQPKEDNKTEDPKM